MRENRERERESEKKGKTPLWTPRVLAALLLFKLGHCLLRPFVVLFTAASLASAAPLALLLDSAVGILSSLVDKTLQLAAGQLEEPKQILVCWNR